MCKDLISSSVRIEETATSFKGEDKRLFLDLARTMLQCMPEDMKTGRELLEHLWPVV
jgi:hypothetical protein